MALVKCALAVDDRRKIKLSGYVKSRLNYLGQLSQIV